MNYGLITALCAILMLALMVVAIFIWKSKVDQQLIALKRIGEMMKKSGMDMDPNQFQGYDQQINYQQPYAEPQFEQPVAPATPQTQPEFQQPEMAQPQVQPEPEIAFAAPQQPIQEQHVNEGFAPDNPMFKFQQQAQEFVEERKIMPQAPEAMPQAPQFEQPAAPQQQFAQQAQPAAPQAPQYKHPQNPNVVVSDIAGMGTHHQASAQMQQNMQERVHMQTQQAMAEKYSMAKSGKVYDKSEIESIIKD